MLETITHGRDNQSAVEVPAEKTKLKDAYDKVIASFGYLSTSFLRFLPPDAIAPARFVGFFTHLPRRKDVSCRRFTKDDRQHVFRASVDSLQAFSSKWFRTETSDLITVLVGHFNGNLMHFGPRILMHALCKPLVPEECETCKTAADLGKDDAILLHGGLRRDRSRAPIFHDEGVARDSANRTNYSAVSAFLLRYPFVDIFDDEGVMHGTSFEVRRFQNLVEH